MWLKHYKPIIILTALVILFLAQRCGILFFADAHIYHPCFDETVSGTLASDFKNYCIRAPLFAYQYLDYTGDIMLESILLMPVYSLLGTSLINLKFFALLSSLISLLVWFAILNRYQGIWAAVIFSALFALPPPTFARLNLLGTPSAHHLLNPILAVQLLLFFRILEKKLRPPTVWPYAWLGLCAGLGMYTYYSHLIFNLFCLLFLIVFKPSLFRMRNITACVCGAVAGFIPWILRSFACPGGWFFLKGLLSGSGAGFDPWNIVLTFFYNMPHSFGFGYPSNTIGLISICYACMIVLFSFIIIRKLLKDYRGLNLLHSRNTLNSISTADLTAIFLCLFPPFFLLCVSASSKQIPMFEYLQNIGLFAPFPPLDCIRYRYFHIIYPFYFAIAAVGTLRVCSDTAARLFSKAIIILCCSIMILCGVVKSLQMYSPDSQFRLLYFKGFNYELLAPHFLLGYFAPRDLSMAQHFASEYPDDSKAEIYQSLGTRVAMDLMQSPDKKRKLLQHINKTPAPYIHDFIFGIVRTFQSVPEAMFSPFISILAENYPESFYTNWGFRYLSYKYYGSLINQQVLLANISPAEKWFYKKFITTFKQATHSTELDENKGKLLLEINNTPEEHRLAVVSGLAECIGAAMLFDPLLAPDYPLDSSFGRKLSTELQPAFYEGVGRGFAATLCCFWNKILSPEEIDRSRYTNMLELEWERAQKLVLKMPADLIPFIQKGLISELLDRNLNPVIKAYLEDKNVAE